MPKTPRRSDSVLWRSVLISTFALVLPLGIIYYTNSADPTEEQPVLVERMNRLPPTPLAAPQLALLQPTAAAAPPSQGIFHLCEEKGQLVYKIRLKADGDEMTVDAATGKLINVSKKS